jgi:hypothetical protein
VNGDGFEQAGGDEAVALAVKVQQRVGGLAADDPALVAYSDDRVGEPGALLGGVDLLVDGGQRIQPHSGSSCSIASRTRWRSGPISLGSVTSSERSREVHQFPGEVVERAVGEAVELVDCLTGELGDVRAGELLL